MDSKLNKKDRMNRAKDSKDKKSEKPVDKTKQKKRGGGFAPPEDDDVDSRGNIRNLIAYSDESGLITDDESPRQKRHNQSRKSDKKPRKISVSDEEDDDIQPRRRGFHPRKAAVKAGDKIKRKAETESEDEDYDSEEESEQPTTLESEEADEDDEEEEYDEEEDEDTPPRNRILLNFGFGDSSSVDERMIPKRYKIKKEPESVQKFFKLMTEPIETETIDDHIDQFKALKEDEQKRMITVLENRPKAKDQPVMFKILNMRTTPEIQANLLAKYNNLQSMEPGSGEYFKMRNWLDKAISLPLGVRKEIPAKVDDGPEICQAFMARAKKCLDEAIYGQEESKLQILQFIAGKITNPESRGMSLLLVGPPGIGKTSLIKQGIAKALDWPFQFISLGGDSDASTFSGHQLVYEGSHCGKIVNSLVAAKSMSMVLMFDELDKVSSTPKGEEIQNLLVHLTDPTQNADFEDKYLSGIPLDLSQAMFVFSANDITKIDRVLLDRFLVVELEGYGPKEKMEIAEKFLLPGALKEVSLGERVGIPKEVVTHIMENYAKEEKGVRELKRCMEQIAQKLNMLRLFNSPDLPFYIKDFCLPFILKKEHVDKFLKDKKAKIDASVQRMYT
uniref:AAA+ ATPase domain-containing protein n=1 Tax=viral metagenome TaxID=1070528 RepID=A0A6C0K7Z4_9ZZZZ